MPQYSFGLAEVNSQLHQHKELGFEDQKRWEDKQKKLKEIAQILKNGGKIEK
jgi:hypothetical protein